MQLRDRIYILTVIAACVVGFYTLTPPKTELPVVNPGREFFNFDPQLPDFNDYSDVKEKKAAFFEFMLPLIEQENQRIAVLREQLLKLANKTEPLNKDEQAWLLELAEHYRVVATHNAEKPLDTRWLCNQLLSRVDQVPPSLALAQAANESAWGTSRFAVEGNNLYGLWCFRKGCGLVPGDRPDEANYEVAKYYSPRQSVRRYIHNLNTHLAYQDFRAAREQQREQNQPLSGKKSVATLTRYSTRGEDYISELRAMIRVNRLDQYDNL